MKVAVLCGGRSYERSVSLRSGNAVADALRELSHDVELLDTGPELSRVLQGGDFGCAFIALHGQGGEDGSIQELLELLGIPYTGSRPGPSQRAFDKALAKRALRAAGIATPEFVSLTSTAIQEFGAADALAEVAEVIGFPMVVKPATGGSALGVRFVADAGDLPRALMAAMAYDPHVVIERYVAGHELSVGLLGTDDPLVLPAVQIVPRHSDYFDFESRYTHGETEFNCPPADVGDDGLATVRDIALASFRALDLSGIGRVDMMFDAEGVPWVLELNSIPGMTDTSLVPLACATAGVPMTRVVGDLLADALEQHSVELTSE